MTPLRKKRLLILATKPHNRHKRWYSQYCVLMGEGLVCWQIGAAFLTDKGKKYLEEFDGC